VPSGKFLTALGQSGVRYWGRGMGVAHAGQRAFCLEELQGEVLGGLGSGDGRMVSNESHLERLQAKVMFRLFGINQSHGDMASMSAAGWHNLTQSEQLDAAEDLLFRPERRFKAGGGALLDLTQMKASNRAPAREKERLAELRHRIDHGYEERERDVWLMMADEEARKREDARELARLRRHIVSTVQVRASPSYQEFYGMEANAVIITN